jgi:hypothetical protein
LQGTPRWAYFLGGSVAIVLALVQWFWGDRLDGLTRSALGRGPRKKESQFLLFWTRRAMPSIFVVAGIVSLLEGIRGKRF